MNYIASFFKRAPTAESLWNEMVVSRTTKEGKYNPPSTEEEELILEKVQEFVKANPTNLFKMLDGQNGQHTLLITSLKFQMKTVAEYLLQEGADVNFFANYQGVQYPVDPEKLIPIRIAIENHWFDLAKTMTKKVDTSLSTHTSLVKLAIQEGAGEQLVQALVDKASPQELALVVEQDQAQRFASQAKAVKLLFNKFKHKLPAQTPMHVAAQKACFGMVQVLQQSGHPLNPVNGDEGTPLQVATAMGHEDVVVTLLGAGANPNTAATNGNTPLHVTTNPEIIQCLIENGANPFLTNNKGTMPFSQMLQNTEKQNYDGSFEAIFTSLNKQLVAMQSKIQGSPVRGNNTEAKQILSKTTSEYISEINNPAFQEAWKEMGGSKHETLIDLLGKASIVLNAFVVEKKGVSFPHLQQLVSTMSSSVANIISNEKFGGIVRETKNSPQAGKMQEILNTLDKVAQAEGMTRVQKSIAIHKKAIGG